MSATIRYQSRTNPDGSRTCHTIRLTSWEAHNSCEWNPEEQERMYRMGRRDAEGMYQTIEEVRYGITHYAQRAALAHGFYEQGIHDRLTEILEAMEREPGQLRQLTLEVA